MADRVAVDMDNKTPTLRRLLKLLHRLEELVVARAGMEVAVMAVTVVIAVVMVDKEVMEDRVVTVAQAVREDMVLHHQVDMVVLDLMLQHQQVLRLQVVAGN